MNEPMSTTVVMKARRRRLLVWAGRLVTLVIVVGGWQLFTSAKIVDKFFWGQPSGIVSQLNDWVRHGTAYGSIWLQIWITFKEALLGFVLGVIAGVVVGVVLGQFRFVADVISPYIKITNAIPRIVLGSLFTVALGLGIAPKVLLAAVLVFFVVFFNAFQGVREVDRNLLNNARVLGASRAAITRHVVIPSALTWIIASLHVAFGLAIIGAIVGEFLGAQKGLGLVIATAQNNFNPDGVFAAMFIIAVLALTAEGVIGLLERRLLSWRPPSPAEVAAALQIPHQDTRRNLMLRRSVKAMGAAASVAALAAGLTACGSSGSSSGAAGSGSTSAGSASTGSAGAGSAGTASLPTVTLMVGGIDKQIYLPYQLAQDLGYYKKYGVNVQLSTEQAGGVGAETAMVSGQVDMAGAWYVHAIDFQAKGQNVVDVVQLSGAPGEREMCAKGSGITSPAQWKGKSLGVTDIGSGTDNLTLYLAARYHLGSKDINRVAVGAGPTFLAALQNNRIACGMTTQPTVGAVESQGAGASVINLATTSGAKQWLGGAYPAAGVLARADWVASHQDVVQKVVDALVATMHWISTHSAADIANAMPPAFVSNGLTTKAAYISELAQDKGQFLPDGMMPADGPATVLAIEKFIGNVTGSVDLTTTYTNQYAIAANKLEGFGG